MRKLLGWFLFLLLVYTPAYANDKERFQTLTQEIRCVTCQGQSIADSEAPLAFDLRNKVYRMISEQKSDDEIKNYLVKRYGEAILLNPRLSARTWFLWGFPLLGLSCVCFFLVRVSRSKENMLP